MLFFQHPGEFSGLLYPAPSIRFTVKDQDGYIARQLIREFDRRPFSELLLRVVGVAKDHLLENRVENRPVFQECGEVSWGSADNRGFHLGPIFLQGLERHHPTPAPAVGGRCF